MTDVPAPIAELASRYDATIFATQRDKARVRLEGAGSDVDALLEGETLRVVPADPDRPPGRRAARRRRDVAQHRRGPPRRDGGVPLRAPAHPPRPAPGRRPPGRHVGVARPDGLRFRHVETRMGSISAMEAGRGAPVVLLHGLGATKASFLPTVAALAPDHRVIAIDLLGFGDSDKPIAAGYDPRFFARSVEALLDALAIERATSWATAWVAAWRWRSGCARPSARIASRCSRRRWPGCATARGRRSCASSAPSSGSCSRRPGGSSRHHGPAPARTRPRAGPRRGRRVPALVPDRAGRAAFYARRATSTSRSRTGRRASGRAWRRCARPRCSCGAGGDRLVPFGFAAHVRRTLPQAEHLELDCGHVPQLERPEATHEAIRGFLARIPVA
jgi:pimeloyl-ACP methyl ester carboxylesterase